MALANQIQITDNSLKHPGAKQGFRLPLQHSHQHKLHHNWEALRYPKPLLTRSGATATTLASAPVIMHTEIETDDPYER